MMGEAFRLLRVFHGIKQVDMAKVLGVHTSFLSEIESGKRKPSLDLVGKCAKHFGLRPSAILFFSEELDGSAFRGTVKEKIRGKMLTFLKAVEAYGETTGRMPPEKSAKRKNSSRNSRSVDL